ncbi:MAG: hypothetical protein LBN23_08110 [Paludibacter sp.]|jgi:hypothetical protein|nr:hypothetical protein [Paludibacter sp.]
MKKTFLISLIFLTTLSISFSQNENYKRFYISQKIGYDFSFGNTNSIINYDIADVELPAFSGFVLDNFEFAYFFSKNYGVGLKSLSDFCIGEKQKATLFYTSDNGDWAKKELYQVQEGILYGGLAVFGRWNLPNSKITFRANAGVGYVVDYINAEYMVAVMFIPEIDYYFVSESLQPQSFFGKFSDNGNSIGFTLSAGLNYKITDFFGLDFSIDGLFADIDFKNNEGYYMTSQEDVMYPFKFTRKINRVGINAGVYFTF